MRVTIGRDLTGEFGAALPAETSALMVVRPDRYVAAAMPFDPAHVGDFAAAVKAMVTQTHAAAAAFAGRGVEVTVLMTKHKPASIGEILVEEFIEPLGLTQGDLAEAMGVPRKHVNELCNDRRAITADTALMLARVFGNSADFWLNVQRRNDLWDALHSPERRQRIERARPVRPAA